MDLKNYFQPWFRLGYYILLVPFRVEKDGKNYAIWTNIIQQISCAIFHALVCLSVIFEINGELVQNARNRDPGLFLRLMQRINSGFLIYSFFYTIWKRQDVVLHIFGKPEPFQTRKIMYYSTIFTTLLFLSTILAFSSWLTYFHLENLVNFKQIWTQYADKVKSDLGLPQSTEIHFGWTILITTSLMARLFKWVFNDMLLGLTVISSYVCLTLGTEFYKVLLEHSPTSDSAERIVFENYHKLKEVVNKLNDFLGPTYTVAFASMITICAFNIVDIVNSKSWNLPIVMSFYFGMFFSSFIFAAHAHYKISHFKTWLLSRPKKSATTLSEFLEVENCNLGLKGGPFFTISYGFLGTAFSVLLTYAIITIQLRPDGSDGVTRL